MKLGLGVGIMILKDKKVLLGLRNPDKEKASSELNGAGTWTMPGGKVEFMEKLIDAAARELKEETNICASDLESAAVAKICKINNVKCVIIYRIKGGEKL